MADQKISALTSYTTALNADEFPIVDIANGITKQITWQNLQKSVASSNLELAATGTVNGINAAFTFTQKPSYIVSDHAVYKTTNKGGGTNWTWNGGTLTATLTVPPTEDIYGIV